MKGGGYLAPATKLKHVTTEVAVITSEVAVINAGEQSIDGATHKVSPRTMPKP